MKTTPINRIINSGFIQFFVKYKVLLAIIILGFLLRLFQLGHDILWYDEVGVFGVTKAKSLEEIVFIVRSHVMAMPMDYVITWLFSRLGTSNAILRFPSVIWGTLTLPVCYVLIKDLLDSRSALWTTFLVAISPFHIQYSQELRFYASLTFFYGLSTLLLFRAIKSSDPKKWIIFTCTTIIGVYFHMYVLLILVNGVFWYFFLEKGKLENQKAFRAQILSYTLILLAFAIGFFAFSGRVSFANPFLENGISFTQTLLTGLGWFPFYANSLEWSWVWGFLCMFLEIWGFVLLRKEQKWSATLLVFSILMQAGGIIALDLIKQYYFMPRQLLPFLPVLLMMAGLACAELDQRLADRVISINKAFNQPWIKTASTTMLVLIVLLINFPAMRTYYNGSKGNADKITSAIQHTWVPGSTVLVVNPYEAGYYNHFFAEVLHSESIIPSVWQADWTTIEDSRNWPEKSYVISLYLLTPEEKLILTTAGYRLYPLDYEFSRYNRLLWVKEK